MGRGWPTGATGTVELVRADVDEARRVAVVAALEDGHVAPAGRGPGHPQRQLVGLAPGVHEMDDLEARRQRRDQPVGVLEDRRVEVASVGLEERHLASGGLDDSRVRMADMGDVVDEVEVRPAVRVVQVGAGSRGRW